MAKVFETCMSTCLSTLPCTLKIEDDYKSSSYDGIVIVVTPETIKSSRLGSLLEPLKSKIKVDNEAESEVVVLPTDLPAKRLVCSPTGPVNVDYVDVRAFSEATKKGIARALKSGSKSPLLILPSHPGFKYCELVSILGALEELYVNLQLREDVPEKAQKVKVLGLYSENASILPNVVRLATALESGRYVARDIGGSDPERMAPPKVEEYIKQLFKDSEVKVEVISEAKVLSEEYPLFSAVDRAARGIPRHQGRIVYLTYEPAGPIRKTLYLVGKGVTYDTGGADIKAGGVMAGMSRDKCGAAAATGFMKVVATLKPKGIKVVAGVPLVRNSVGANSYVADEVITCRNKLRVRIGNTDAEGRMIMGDVLCKLRESAETAEDPHLITIATLTGHAVLTVGSGYSIVLDNGPARKSSHAEKLQEAGEELGDMIEISRIRREDVAFHRGKGMGDDVYQANNLPSSRTPRGHQGPAGFLLLVSGLDKHGSESRIPLKYSHIDIAGSAGDLPHDATGAPILSLAAHHLHDCFS